MGKKNIAEDTERENTGEKTGKKWGILALAIVLLLIAGVGTAVGIGIYNTPEKRVTRQLQTAYKYLKEGDYEKAALAFEQVIAIDKKCIEAYAKGIEAYIKCGDEEKTRDLFERAMKQIGELDEDILSKNMEYIVDIYLSVRDVYGDDSAHMAEILEKGLEVTEGNEQMLSALKDCVGQYIDLLVGGEQYDEAYALVEKYRDVLGADYDTLIRRLQEGKQFAEENRKFMQNVYDRMAAQNYEAMHQVDGSDEAEAFVERMAGDCYIFFPEENAQKTGVGAGVYKSGEDGYYFYYGDYVNGLRTGDGTGFMNWSKGGYEVFHGKWDQDAPNGRGEQIIDSYLSRDGNHYYQTNEGDLLNGMWDGDVEAKMTVDYESWNYDSDQWETKRFTGDVSFHAVRGIPEDRTREYVELSGYDWFGKKFIYAFANYVDYKWAYFWVSKGETLTVLGLEGENRYADWYDDLSGKEADFKFMTQEEKYGYESENAGDGGYFNVIMNIALEGAEKIYCVISDQEFTDAKEIERNAERVDQVGDDVWEKWIGNREDISSGKILYVVGWNPLGYSKIASYDLYDSYRGGNACTYKIEDSDGDGIEDTVTFQVEDAEFYWTERWFPGTGGMGYGKDCSIELSEYSEIASVYITPADRHGESDTTFYYTLRIKNGKIQVEEYKSEEDCNAAYENYHREITYW